MINVATPSTNGSGDHQQSTDKLCYVCKGVNHCQDGESAMGRERSGQGQLFGFYILLFHLTNISGTVII